MNCNEMKWIPREEEIGDESLNNDCVLLNKYRIKIINY